MGASTIRFRSRLWPVLSLIIVTLVLLISRGVDATGPAPAQRAGAQQRVFLPHVSNTKLPPQIELVPFTYGFDNITITSITNAGDERLFVSIREGKTWIVNPDGRILPTPFLDIKDRIRYQDNFEQGLLGLAFHPDFPNTPYFYIVYTTHENLEVARGVVNPATPNVVDPQTLQVFITIRKPESSGGPSPVHNGGDLMFGPDGYLYIPIGDGGPDPYDPKGVPGDPYNNAQRRETLFGSILRLDPDPARGLPSDCGLPNFYSIPRDNPWLNDNGCNEIWAHGLRNPWRMSIDHLTGDFYVADVGEWLREEVNYLPADQAGGQNFGWHCWEGTVDYSLIQPKVAPLCQKDTTYTFPVFEYDHSHGECSIIGGKLYRGAQYPALYGHYFFGDWCTGQLWTMYNYQDQWRVETAGTRRILFSTFGEDVHGELYAGSYADGTLYKVKVR